MAKTKIAIVEDSTDDLEQLIQCLDRFAGERQEGMEYAVFQNGLEFLENYRPVYDVVFMDIEMPQMDGMAAARKLREMDAQTILIFVTRMAQYAIQGYAVSAMDFIVKPVPYGELSEKLDRALRRLEKQTRPRRFVYLETGADSYRKIDFDDIRYITKYLNYIIYATTDGEIRVRGTLKEAEDTFAGSEIVKCAKGLMVNLRHVEQKIKNVVYVGGVQFTVTKPYMEEFTRAFMSFLKGAQEEK